MSTWVHRTVELPSGEATFLEAGIGNAKTILLLHGGGLDCASLSWRYLIPELSRDYHVIAPNWPGYAGTPGFGRPFTISDLGAWLITFLDTLDVHRASMVGISMGGGVALWSAIHHPKRVTALVPVGTFGVAERAPYHKLSYLLTKLPLNALTYALMRRYPKSLKRALEGLFADPKRVTPELVTEVAEVLRTAGNGAAFSQFQRGEMTVSRLRTVFDDDLKTVHHPTLFIHGRNDALVPLDAVKHAATLVQNARLEILDAGHWPMRERPIEFNKTVVSFLNSVHA